MTGHVNMRIILSRLTTVVLKKSYLLALFFGTSFLSTIFLCTSFLITIFVYTSLHAHDNVHFYRATRLLYPEPRFEKPWLTTFELAVGGGRTHTAFNGSGHKTSIFDIYGNHNLHALGENIPNLDPSNPLDQILIQLADLPADKPFGVLSFDGKFSTVELNALFIQNFTHGFFVEAHMPARTLTISDITQQDLTSDTGTFNKNSPEWQNFLSSFDAILARYNLCSPTTQKPVHGIHQGDTTLLVGWTRNYEETKKLDFIDCTFKVGVLFPTGKAKNENQIFSLPYGYNKHWGFPVCAHVAIGCFEWLSLGAYLDTLFFAPRSGHYRLKTACDQQGLITLACGPATEHHGTQVLVGGYVKADHLIKGLSLLTGYSFAHKMDDTLTPKECADFNFDIINSQEQLKDYSMHTLHFFIEYDFTKECHIFGPRIDFFANIPVSGKRIFKTNCYEFGCGLELSL